MFGAALLYHRGARIDRCTQLARQLARGFFKSDIVPRTCLGELDKVEQYLNKGKQLHEWLGIRVYEPERQQNGEIYWHLRKNPSDKLKNIMAIGIYEGHAFLIKDITKLAKTYVCNDRRSRFTQATQPSKTRQNMLTRKNNNRLPKREG